MSASPPGPTIAAVQARMSSSRLPGKVLEDLAGKPLIERVVERLRTCRRVDEVFVLTSLEPSDDPLVAACEARGIALRRGPLNDVLARFAALAEELDPRYLVRVTGDAPLVHPPFVDLQLEALEAFDGDLVRIAGGTHDLEGVLGGQSAFSARALRTALGSDDPRDREHVASFYFQSHPLEFRWVEVAVDDALRQPDLRLCVDEPSDLALVRRVFEAFADADAPVPLEDVLAWLRAHPEVCELNRGVDESRDNQALRRLARDTREQAFPAVGTWP